MVVRELAYVLDKVRKFLLDDLAEAAFCQEARFACGGLYRAAVKEGI